MLEQNQERTAAYQPGSRRLQMQKNGPLYFKGSRFLVGIYLLGSSIYFIMKTRSNKVASDFTDEIFCFRRAYFKDFFI